jgi:hypothetical protein
MRGSQAAVNVSFLLVELSPADLDISFAYGEPIRIASTWRAATLKRLHSYQHFQGILD